jgi:Na+/melibiose symporter-like transporter
MIPDIVDLATLRRKKGEAGVYMAIYFLVQKLAQALGIGLGLPLLETLGFSLHDPTSAAGRHAIHVVSLYVPAALTLPVIALLWSYPLTRRRHAVVRQWLDRRTRRLSAVSPDVVSPRDT